MKQITYKEKYDEFVDLYGIEIGEKKYHNFLKGGSLEAYIYKFGVEEGTKKYNDNRIKRIGNNTIQYYINKYGTELGTEKYNKWKSEVVQNEENFIKRYGETEGKKKFDQFRKKSAHTLDNYIEKYGETIGFEKYNNYKKNKGGIHSIRSIEYWINKYNLSHEEAAKSLSKFQDFSSLSYYIEKYGEETGTKQYLDTNKKRKISKEKFIDLYGDERGIEKFNNWIENLKYSKSIEYYIKKYGEIDGKEKHKEILLKKVFNISKISNISLEFFNIINSKISKYFNEIYFGENEYKFFIFSDDINVLFPDFYIKDINLVIEFYGDFWHANPKKYNSLDFIKSPMNKLAHNIWGEDYKRIKKIQERFDSLVIIIWENDYRNNKELIIKNTIENIMKIKESINE